MFDGHILSYIFENHWNYFGIILRISFDVNKFSHCLIQIYDQLRPFFLATIENGYLSDAHLCGLTMKNNDHLIVIDFLNKPHFAIGIVHWDINKWAYVKAAVRFSIFI